MAKRVKTNYDRGYVNAMDKIRVFIESSSKVMYVDTREYIRMLRRHAVLTGTRSRWCGQEESCVLLATAMNFS